MTKIIQKMTMLFALMSLSALVVGCNTVRGFGQDVERGGQKLQHTATVVQTKPKPSVRRTTTTTTTYRSTSY